MRRIIIVLLFVFAIVGCRRRQTEVTPIQSELIVLKVDTSLLYSDHLKVEIPDTWKLNFYDTQTGALKYSNTFHGTTSNISLPYGKYNSIAYNLGSSYAFFENEESFTSFKEFTGKVEDYFDKILQEKWAKYQHLYPEFADVPYPPVVYQPDDMWSGVGKGVQIPTGDSVLTVACEPLTKRCRLHLVNIKGLQNIASIKAYITNVARGAYLGNYAPIEENVTVLIPEAKNIQQDSSLVTYFRFFGKLTVENMEVIARKHNKSISGAVTAAYTYGFFNELYLLITDTGGGQYLFNFDVTQQIQSDTFLIEVDCGIDIPAPEHGGGGLAPDVTDWTDIIVPIDL